MKPSIHVTPLQSNFDEEIDIVIRGCNPGDEVTLKASLSDDRNELFMSEATFKVSQNREVDLAKEAPITGTYTGVDPNGIFWSAIHKKKKYDDYFLKSNTNELKVLLQLYRENDVMDEVQINRFFYQEQVKFTRIHEKNTVGTLYQPKVSGHYPNVVLLAGSDGGQLGPAASLLASKGYTVFDLAYFNQDGVPNDLENIPLEYFYQSIQLLKKHTNSDKKVTLIGYSRGAELALLLASEYDEFCAVIAGAPGAYITSGLKNSIYAPIPSWTLNDEAKPYLKFQHRPRTMFPLLKQWILRRPASFFGIWEDSLKKLDELEEKRIKVEQIKAPVLLLSGDRDQIWPASEFVNVIQSNLTDAKHIQYVEGGHFIAFPYALPHLPSNNYEHVGGGMIMYSGGSKKANAAAAKDSWPLICEFIKKHTQL